MLTSLNFFSLPVYPLIPPTRADSTFVEWHIAIRLHKHMDATVAAAAAVSTVAFNTFEKQIEFLVRHKGVANGFRRDFFLVCEYNIDP